MVGNRDLSVPGRGCKNFIVTEQKVTYEDIYQIH